MLALLRKVWLLWTSSGIPFYFYSNVFSFLRAFNEYIQTTIYFRAPVGCRYMWSSHCQQRMPLFPPELLGLRRLHIYIIHRVTKANFLIYRSWIACIRVGQFFKTNRCYCWCKFCIPLRRTARKWVWQRFAGICTLDFCPVSEWMSGLMDGV